ncbi:MAG: class C sortase [Lactobacillales bacterium]|jgi:sortase A|nr:class C sortase [Lactobacillales bacterium]
MSKLQKNTKTHRGFFFYLRIIALIAGLGMLLYPTIGNYFSQKQHSYVVEGYDKTINEMNAKKVQQYKDDAILYNHNLYLLSKGGVVTELPTNPKPYDEILRVDGTDMIAYLDIPQINMNFLPIYHTVNLDVLEMGVGHVPLSSFPIGGESTHAVLGGHSGRKPDRAFTELLKLELGDVFYIHILGETHKYEIDQINTVEPEDNRLLKIEQGKDLITLVTCTPIGINSHRFLVRGTRVPMDKETPTEKVKRNRYNYDYVAIGVTLFIFLVILLRVVIKKIRRKKESRLMREKK